MTQEFVLRAMASNYKDGNLWDQLDREAVLKAADELATVTAERDAAREALRPFAEKAAAYDPNEGDDALYAWEHQFPIGDLRRARAALAKENPDG